MVSLDARTLVHDGGGLYQLPGGTEANETPATDARLRQGFLEQSNVDIPSGNIGQLQRHFQSLSRALAVVNGLDRRLINSVRGS